MTPPRLVQLKCPNCATTNWTIECDYRGIGGTDVDYPERDYKCPTCGYAEAGYIVVQQSPPEFLLQPHPMYPMSQKDFDYWAEILQTNFPDHPMVQQLGKEFKPNTRVFLTKLENIWWDVQEQVRRRIKLLWVDIEDWLPERVHQQLDFHPIVSEVYQTEPLDTSFQTVSIYISHSHFPDDSKLVFDLEDYLNSKLDKLTVDNEFFRREQITAYRRAVDIWCDHRVTRSTSWQDVVNDREFEAANYLLLVVSPDYLASKYCRRQMARAAEREQAGTARVIPVLLCPVDWQAPAHWKLLPRNGVPLTNWPDREEAFADIAEGVLEAIPAEVQKKWVDDDIEYWLPGDATSSAHS